MVQSFQDGLHDAQPSSTISNQLQLLNMQSFAGASGVFYTVAVLICLMQVSERDGESVKQRTCQG